MSFTISKDGRLALLNIATQVRISPNSFQFNFFIIRVFIFGIYMIDNLFVNIKVSPKGIMSIMQPLVGLMKNLLLVVVKVSENVPLIFII
jgi:hypothetical protein